MGSIKIIRDESHKQLIFNAKFSVDSLDFRIHAVWSLEKDVPILLEENLKNDGEKIYESTTTFHPKSVSKYFDFGPKVKGIKNMTLLVETLRNVKFLTGYVDGNQIIPIRMEGISCNNELGNSNKLFILKNEIKLEEVSYTLFNKELTDSIQKLSDVIRREVHYYKSTKEAVEFSTLPVCFWGMASCYAGTLACMASFGWTGVGAAICAAAGIICYAAVAESHVQIDA